ncbi:MAG: alpha/beta fold hydrolase [Myxococcota bacterium]
MIELLNPKPIDVVRFAADVIKFRSRYAFTRDAAAARELAVDRFCTPTGRRGSLSQAELEADLERLYRQPPTEEQRGRIREVLDTVELSWLPVDGATLCVYRWSPGKAHRRALLAHGWEGYGLSLGPFVRDLLSEGYEVIAFDQRAHGASDGRFSGLPNFVWDLEAVVERFGSFDFVLGHSLGGAAVLQALARKTLGTPRSVLLAPFGDMSHLAAGWSRLNGLGRSFGPQLIEGLSHRYDYDPESVTVRAISKRIQSPVHIVHDRADPIVPIRTSLELAAANNLVTVDATEGLGHAALLAAPKALEIAARLAA